MLFQNGRTVNQLFDALAAGKDAVKCFRMYEIVRNNIIKYNMYYVDSGKIIVINYNDH